MQKVYRCKSNKRIHYILEKLDISQQYDSNRLFFCHNVPFSVVCWCGRQHLQHPVPHKETWQDETYEIFS